MTLQKNQLIDQTITTFATRYGTKLSKENARECIDNLAGFAGVLLEWHAKDKTRRTKKHRTEQYQNQNSFTYDSVLQTNKKAGEDWRQLPAFNEDKNDFNTKY